MRFCVVLEAMSSTSEALSEFLSAVRMIMVVALILGGMTYRLPSVGSASLGDLASAQLSRSFFFSSLPARLAPATRLSCSFLNGSFPAQGPSPVCSPRRKRHYPHLFFLGVSAPLTGFVRVL